MPSRSSGLSTEHRGIPMHGHTNFWAAVRQVLAGRSFLGLPSVGAPSFFRGITMQDIKADPAVPGDWPIGCAPSDELRRMVTAELRRRARCFDYDWPAFVDSGPAWTVAEIVHRRLVSRSAGLAPSEVPYTALVDRSQEVLTHWERHPDQRPSRAGFCAAQSRRALAGRVTQQAASAARAVRVMELVDGGLTNNAEISRRLGLHRSTVMRIRRRVRPAECPAVPARRPAFPAPDIAPHRRWPVVRFMSATGLVLDAEEARWLASIGDCYEAEGRVDELASALRASAAARVDSFGYLARCIVNRGDAWSVSPGLLADVAVWSGPSSLRYALHAIGAGYVARPLPYLRRVLASAVPSGRHAAPPECPVAFAVQLARSSAPNLAVPGADDAVAAEVDEHRSRHVNSYRRRFGRLPWDPPAGEEDSSAEDSCAGLGVSLGGDYLLRTVEQKSDRSSPAFPQGGCNGTSASSGCL